MELDKEMQNISQNANCNEQLVLQLIDFIDGTLSKEDSFVVLAHMDSCIKCKNMYQMLVNSRKLTDKLNNNKMDYLLKTTELVKCQQIDKIKMSINNDNQNKKNNLFLVSEKSITKRTLQNLDNRKQNINVNSNLKKIKNKILSIYSNKWAYVPSVAGIVVLILISYIFLGKNGNIKLSKITNQEGAMVAQSQNNAEIAEDSAKDMTGSNDLAIAKDQNTSAMIQDSGTSNEFYGVTDSNSSAMLPEISSAKPASSPDYYTLPNDGVKTGMENIIKIMPEYGNEFWSTLPGSISYLEIVNDVNYYTAIVVFPSNIINDKKVQIVAIYNKSNLTNTSNNIEIISGEDSQKLLKYTSERNVNLLRTVADNNSAKFLVIFICR